MSFRACLYEQRMLFLVHQQILQFPKNWFWRGGGGMGGQLENLSTISDRVEPHFQCIQLQLTSRLIFTWCHFG